MLELPGITTSGDAQQDVQRILRYLSKLVPQLEMELANAQQDGYLEQYNARAQGVGSVNDKTTAGALVAHEMRRDNPHAVTAAQLGLTLDKLLAVTLTNGGLTARIGEKLGIQINVQDKRAAINVWEESGNVQYADVDLGDWDVKIPLLYYTGVTIDGTGSMDVWAGPLELSDGEHAGTLRIYRGKQPTTVIVGEEENTDETTDVATTVKIRILGVGVFGYVGQQGEDN